MKKSIALFLMIALLFTLSSCGSADVGYFYEIDETCTIVYNGSYSDDGQEDTDNISWTVTILESESPVYGIIFPEVDENGLLYGDEAFAGERAEGSDDADYTMDFCLCSKSPFTYTVGIDKLMIDTTPTATVEHPYDYESEEERPFRVRAGGEIWYIDRLPAFPLYDDWEIDVEDADFSGVAPFYDGYEPEPVAGPGGYGVVDDKESYGEAGDFSGYYYEAMQYYIEQYLIEEQ